MSEVGKSPHDRIRRLELSLLDPGVRASADLLNDLIADDFVEFASTGRTFGKDEVLIRLPAECGVGFTVDDFRTCILSADVVLATYRAIRSTDAGRNRQHSLRSSIWKHSAAGWQMVFHQGTPAPPG